jgi:hypothetical protein
MADADAGRTVLCVQESATPTTLDAPRPRCPSCGELLGVYEPLILDAGDGHPVRTSLLRLSPGERAAAHAAGSLFHASCRADVTPHEPARRRASSP